MRNILLTTILLVSLYSCNTYKGAQKDIYAGNFDQALDNMLKKYAKGNIKNKDVAQWSSVFNTAYSKANSRNIDEIYKLSFTSESSEKYRAIISNYASLQSRYDKLKPFLPIKVNDEVIAINHENYSFQLEQYQVKLTNVLYAEAESLMKSNDKYNARFAYEKYAEIAQLNPNYANIQDKVNQAYQYGLTHVLVSIHNDSRSILPRNLHQDLTSISPNNEASFWQKYHTQASNMSYDYRVELNFRAIEVSPTWIDKSYSDYKKEWIDSSEIAKDRRGVVIKDSFGNPIKINIKKQILCRVNSILHKKSSRIVSEFILLDNRGTVLSRIAPIESNMNFNQISYQIIGDEQALDRDLLKKIHHQKNVLIPTDEQMVFDCGQDLKLRFSNFALEQIANK